MPAFADLVTYFLDELFALQPDIATAVGDHRYDDQWPDTSEAGRQGRLAFADRWRKAFGDLDPTRRCRATTGSTATWSWASSMPPVRRGDPPRGRLGPDAVGLPPGRRPPPAARARVRAAATAAGVGRGPARGRSPRIVADARATIGQRHPSARCPGSTPRSPASASAGSRTLGRGRRSRRPRPPRPRRRGRRRAPAAAAGRGRRGGGGARRRSGRHLADEVAPARPGGAALGEALFAEPSCATRCATRRSRPRRSSPAPSASSPPSAPRWSGSRATIWPAWCPASRSPDDEGALVRRRARRDRDRPPGRRRARAVQPRRARSASRRSAASASVIGLVDEPLEIDWTPEFMRSFGGAMLDSPGPLDHGQKTFFSITPVPDDWPRRASVESYLREMNTRQMSLLVIHEAVPGHYLQMVVREPRARRSRGACSGPGCSPRAGRSTSPR